MPPPCFSRGSGGGGASSDKKKEDEEDDEEVADLKRRLAEAEKRIEELKKKRVDKMLQCNMCDKKFGTKNSLKSHRHNKHSGPDGGELTKLCHKCGLSFPSANYHRHLNNCQGGI